MSSGPSLSAGGSGTQTSSPSTPVIPSIGSLDEAITPIGATTPYASTPASVPSSTSGFLTPGLRVPGRYFHSRRIKKGEVSKPWLEKKDPREKWVTIIPCVGLFLGLVICGLLVWLGLRSVVNHKYCPVLMEDWSNGFDKSIWTREVEVGGFG